MAELYREFADDIKNRVPMKDVAYFYGFSLTKAGFMPCPFHKEKTASLKVYDGTRGWHCYGCGEGGDIFDFVAKFFDIGFADAVKRINADFCLGFPLEKPTEKEVQKAREKAEALRKKRDNERREHDKLVRDYLTALEWYTTLDRIKLEYIPTENDVNEMYAFACLNIDGAEYALDVAECRLRKYELERRI